MYKHSNSPYNAIGRLIILTSACLFLFACKDNKDKQALSDILPLTKYVDPFIGTGFHGHVFLGANVPFGAVQLGPVNMSEGWDWCFGYHYSDSTKVWAALMPVCK